MRNLQGALACMAIVFSSLPGSAQSSSNWASLYSAPDQGVALQWTLRTGPDGNPILMFRNAGNRSIHFGFYLQGLQTKDDAAGNGRMHLDPGAKATLPLKASPTGVVVLRLRAGEDDGDFLIP